LHGFIPFLIREYDIGESKSRINGGIEYTFIPYSWCFEYGKDIHECCPIGDFCSFWVEEMDMDVAFGLEFFGKVVSLHNGLDSAIYHFIIHFF